MSFHFTGGMPPTKVNPLKHLFWQTINRLRAKIPQGSFKFKMGNLVSTTKEKVKFAKVHVQIFSTEIFMIIKVQCVSQPGYELSDL